MCCSSPGLEPPVPCFLCSRCKESGWKYGTVAKTRIDRLPQKQGIVGSSPGSCELDLVPQTYLLRKSSPDIIDNHDFKLDLSCNSGAALNHLTRFPRFLISKFLVTVPIFILCCTYFCRSFFAYKIKFRLEIQSGKQGLRLSTDKLGRCAARNVVTMRLTQRIKCLRLDAWQNRDDLLTTQHLS